VTLSRSAAPLEAVSVAGLPEPYRPLVPSAAWTWQKYVVAAYLLGFSVLFARLAIGMARARKLVGHAARCEGRLTSGSCAVPITIGWLNPVVILPACWRDWAPSQLEAVLLHEGEHARRRDPLVQWLALLNRAVFWFHPLAWWIERHLSALAEEACDAAVLARGHDPFLYSEYLMQMARAMRQAGARVDLFGMAMPGTSLPRRIRLILDGRPAQRISRARLAGVAVACALISATFTLLALADPPQRPAEAALSGTVEDATGARVPRCNITVRNEAGASVATASTNAAGVYRFGPLVPGRYALEYRASGFASRTIQVQIEQGKPGRIDAALDVGQIFETVEVNAPKLAAAPAAAQPVPRPGPIAVGGSVQAARLLRQSRPVYPPELRQQGIEGTVIVRAQISRAGTILNAHVLNGDEVDPRLAEAALDSVRQWLYQPSKLNSAPVETTTTIAVEFRLGN
jgi:TonB family protein